MNRFTVIERDGCILVEGQLSIDGMRGVTAMCHKNAIVSPQLAGMLGANFAFGLAADVEALIATITPELARTAIAAAAARGLSEKAAIWLASGQRGNSSETMFTHLTGVNANRGSSNCHPFDPDDLKRCRLLLEQVPELQPIFHRMALLSGAWKNLVADWNYICTTMDIETPQWRTGGGKAPKTYNLIKKAIG